MIGRDEIVRKLRETLPDIQRKFPVRRLALFGSSARGEATETSDVDLLVEFDSPIGFFDFIRLETASRGSAARESRPRLCQSVETDYTR